MFNYIQRAKLFNKNRQKSPFIGCNALEFFCMPLYTGEFVRAS